MKPSSRREVITMKRIIILFSFLILLTGCWDKKELNELAIAVGLAIDQAEDGYKLSVQIVNPSEVSPQANASGITPATVRSKQGETIYEAIRKLSLTNSRRIYTSHLRLLVINEDVAKEGITEVLDFLSRDKDFRPDFFIMIARNSKAEDILKVQTVTETIPANALYTLLKTSSKIWGETVSIDLRELLDMIAIPGKSPVLSGMEVIGDLKEGETKANTETTDSLAKFNYLGLGVFHKDQLVGWLNEEEGKGYNYITDKIKNTVGSIACPEEGEMSIEVMRSKTKQRAKMDASGKPKIEVHVRAEANIGETDCSFDLMNIKEINELEKKVEKDITDIIDKTVHKVQEEYKTDIFGFGETIYRTYPKVWNEIKEEWREHFANLDVQAKVKVDIKQLGVIGNPLKQDVEGHE